MLIVPFKVDTVDSNVTPLADVNLSKLNALLTDREKKCAAVLKEAGARDRDIRIQRMADISFEGQGFPLTIPIPSGKITENHFQIIENNFREQYAEIYGRAIADVPLQVFSWRIFGMGPDPKVNFKFSNLTRHSGRNPVKGNRRIYLPETKGFRKVNVYDRYLLKTTQKTRGPALVEERETTMVVGSRSTFYVDKFQNLIVDL
jgi:N-methylhydantoinase A